MEKRGYCKLKEVGLCGEIALEVAMNRLRQPAK
jgi:hypothetical protein